MLAISLIYGSIAGLIVIFSILLSLLNFSSEHVAGLQWLGYLVMVLALSMVFFGVKRYRDRENGGVLRFVPALGLGLLITLVASIIYVVVWEIYLAVTDHAFITGYTEAIIAQHRADGMTGDALETEIAAMEDLKAQYANPLYRLPITFLEIFPVGLIVALVSALILRRPGAAPVRA